MLEIREAKFADFGINDITLKVTLANYPAVLPLRQTFTIYVLLHCERASIVVTAPAKDMYY